MPSSRPSNILNDSKKGYTLKEKYNILQYIIKENAYSEIKGRSFWLKMENSKITTRTWQSLKEVFLKRILPDLRNPYYKLSQEEIRNFSRNSSKPSEAVNWIEKNKAMDKILNRSMSDHNESISSPNKNISPIKNSPGKKKFVANNDVELSSSRNTSSSTIENQQPRDGEVSLNGRTLRNRGKENGLNTETSQSSQDVESFPPNVLPSSTPRKTLKSSNTNAEQNEAAGRAGLSSTGSAKPKTPIKSPAHSNNSTVKEAQGAAAPATHNERRAFSPSIFLLSSSDSSLSEVSDARDQINTSKKNLFGFSAVSVKPNGPANQAIGVSSETDISSSEVARPSTSNHISSRPGNKFSHSFNERSSSDSDNEGGSSLESQYTYYRSNDAESLKRKGKKLYGLFRGKLVPLYEPKRKCCKERRELVANGRISKKDKVVKRKGVTYMDDVEAIRRNPTKTVFNSRLNEGNDLLSKEVLNFWKLKYLSLKRRNDEIMRLLAKEKNEDYVESVTKMLSEPLSTKWSGDHNASGGALPLVDASDPGVLARGSCNPHPVEEMGRGKKFMITSKKSQAPGTLKVLPENDNVVVIDTQKADIIIDILKKVSEMNQPIDPVRVKDILGGTKTPLPPADKPKPATPTKEEGSKRKHPILNTSSIEKVSEEILKLREKEKQIFERISKEQLTAESSTDRDIFSKAELQLLFNEDGKKTLRSKANHQTKGTDNAKSGSTQQSKIPPDTDAKSPDDSTPSKRTKRSDTNVAATSVNETNNIPESMDLEIDDNMKFAINPKYFSVLFPEEPKDKHHHKDKDVESDKELIISSDEESTRYALPKTSPSNQKNLKSRRFSGKVIKLKMFSNLKKDKRQSLEDCGGRLSPCLDAVSSESPEIPLQSFTLNDVDIDGLGRASTLNTYCINTYSFDEDFDKPLLEQDVVPAHSNAERNESCHLCLALDTNSHQNHQSERINQDDWEKDSFIHINVNTENTSTEAHPFALRSNIFDISTISLGSWIEKDESSSSSD